MSWKEPKEEVATSFYCPGCGVSNYAHHWGALFERCDEGTVLECWSCEAGFLWEQPPIVINLGVPGFEWPPW